MGMDQKKIVLEMANTQLWTRYWNNELNNHTAGGVEENQNKLSKLNSDEVGKKHVNHYVVKIDKLNFNIKKAVTVQVRN